MRGAAGEFQPTPEDLAMASLHSLLTDHQPQIDEHLRLVAGSRGHPLGKIGRIEQQAGVCKDEEVWTYLLACAYAIDGARGVASLAEQLTGSPRLSLPEEPAIWLEYRPMTPRIGEARSHMDLSIGNIAVDAGTKGGIAPVGGPEATPWVCFCEMKWESDITPGVANDPKRNQLIRVIESGLYYGWPDSTLAEVYITLVTPGRFRDDTRKLYHRKFNEYTADKGRILEELRNCRLRRRDGFDAATRISALQLRWLTFEELFAALPPSPLCAGIRQFRKTHGDYLNAR